MPAAWRSSCDLTGSPHETVRRALAALSNLEHRGASGADADSGDGAGILIQLPDSLFASVEGLPPPGRYGVGAFFLPLDETHRAELEALVERTVRDEGQRFLVGATSRLPSLRPGLSPPRLLPTSARRSSEPPTASWRTPSSASST